MSDGFPGRVQASCIVRLSKELGSSSQLCCCLLVHWLPSVLGAGQKCGISGTTKPKSAIPRQFWAELEQVRGSFGRLPLSFKKMYMKGRILERRGEERGIHWFILEMDAMTGAELC